MNDSEVNLSQIARLAGVGRAAAANWRRRHGDFPEPIGGTEPSPTFQRAAAKNWLRTHGKLPAGEPPTPREPATVTFAGGPTVTLVAAHLSIPDGWSKEFEALCGFIPADAEVPWPTVDIERADVPGHESFATTRAHVHQLRALGDPALPQAHLAAPGPPPHRCARASTRIHTEYGGGPVTYELLADEAAPTAFTVAIDLIPASGRHLLARCEDRGV